MNTIGKYKIIKELGSGGFGAVYLCEDQLGQQVAIKIYQPKDDAVAGAATSATADAGEVLKQRFKEEAKILHQLSDNTYIVNFMHYDETEDGIPYYVMPFLDRSLVEEIGKDAFSVGAREDLDPELFPRKLPLTRALEVLEQTTKALRAVHRAGLVHRDIKPANILLDKTGQVQLCDFGIAKLPDVEHSQSGVGMGSRNYMSPEQRESAKHVNAASDIYSLGVIAYRIITGTLPVGHFDEPLVLSPAIGDPLNKLILKSLSFDVDKRPQDAQTFLSELKQAIKESNTNEIENDEGTGTWIDEGTSSLKDELWPLYEKIKEAWLNDGMIDVEEHEMFTAMAAVVDLSDDDLNALIKQVEQDHAKVIKPVQNFIKLIDKRIAEQLSPDQRELNQSTLATLTLASQSLNWDEAKLQAILKERSSHITGLSTAETNNTVNEKPIKKKKQTNKTQSNSQSKSKGNNDRKILPNTGKRKFLTSENHSKYYGTGAIILVLLTTFLFTTYWIDRKTEFENSSTAHVNNLNNISREIARNSTEAIAGRESAFQQLKVSMIEFEGLLSLMSTSEQVIGLPELSVLVERSGVKEIALKIKNNANAILQNEELLLTLYKVAETLKEVIPQLQIEYEDVVSILLENDAPADQVSISERQSLRAERIIRSVNNILTGHESMVIEVNRFGNDAALFGRVINSMFEGNEAMDISKVIDEDAIYGLEAIAELYEFVDSNVTYIIGVTPDFFKLRNTANLILEGSLELKENAENLTMVIRQD